MNGKILVVVALMFIVAPASAGFIAIHASGCNPNSIIRVNGDVITIFPDGSSNLVKVGDTATISIEAPGVSFTEVVVSRGLTIYQTPVGAVVSPMGTQTGQIVPFEPPTPPSPPSPPAVEEETPKDEKVKDNNADGSKKPKRNK